MYTWIRKWAIDGLSAICPSNFSFGFVILLALIFAFPPRAFGEDRIAVAVFADPELPEPVMVVMDDILSSTLNQVLFEEYDSEEIRNADPGELSEAIKIGVNIIIEPKGYSVARLELNFTATPGFATFLVHPVGWTPEDPHAVTDVEVLLSDEWLSSFWSERLCRRLDNNRSRLVEVYRDYLVGLPIAVSNTELTLDLVMPDLERCDAAHGIYPGFTITRSIDLGPVAKVTLDLEPTGDVIELIRPRMYSRTLYNVILDRLRERLLAEANFIEGMPRSEIKAAEDEIAEYLARAIEQDALARKFGAEVSVTVAVLPDEATVRLDCVVESRAYDFQLETMVDFGNESRDSSEVQARFGFQLAKGIEIFTNLNFFTNDNTLETDFGFGVRPQRGTFAAVAYDLEREAVKYFFEHKLQTGLMIRGEIFENDVLNEFGMTYQFQQYLSAGLFTNGDNEYWMRGIFIL